MSVKYTDYVKFKVGVLSELGLTNSKKTAETLYRVASNFEDRNKMEHAVDKAARRMIEEFYDGDRSYIRRGVA